VAAAFRQIPEHFRRILLGQLAAGIQFQVQHVHRLAQQTEQGGRHLAEVVLAGYI
jgi:hypothetical protein